MDRIDLLKNVDGRFAGTVTSDMHALRQYSNRADHDGAIDLMPLEKVDIVDRVYRVAKSVLEWQQSGGGAAPGTPQGVARPQRGAPRRAADATTPAVASGTTRYHQVPPGTTKAVSGSMSGAP